MNRGFYIWDGFAQGFVQGTNSSCVIRCSLQEGTPAPPHLEQETLSPDARAGALWIQPYPLRPLSQTNRQALGRWPPATGVNVPSVEDSPFSISIPLPKHVRIPPHSKSLVVTSLPIGPARWRVGESHASTTRAQRLTLRSLSLSDILVSTRPLERRWRQAPVHFAPRVPLGVSQVDCSFPTLRGCLIKRSSTTPIAFTS